MKFSFEVVSGSHYPIETKGIVEANQYHIAARKAVQEHRNHLRELKKIRKQGKKLNIVIQQIN